MISTAFRYDRRYEMVAKKCKKWVMTDAAVPTSRICVTNTDAEYIFEEFGGEALLVLILHSWSIAAFLSGAANNPLRSWDAKTHHYVIRTTLKSSRRDMYFEKTDFRRVSYYNTV